MLDENLTARWCTLKKKTLQESKPKNIPQIKESNHKDLGWIQYTTLIL